MALSPDRRVVALRRLAAHLSDILQADFSLRLWTGEVLPLGPGARPELVLALNTPAAITRLVRRPRLSTVVELIAEGALDIEGGTLLDLAAARGTASRRALRSVDRWLLLRSLAPFLLGTAGDRGTSHAYASAQTEKAESGRDDKALVQFHYDLSNAFYALLLDPEMQYSCAYFPHWDAGIEEAQQAKLEMICRKLRMQPGERFLDIGCGGLICHAAQNHGVIAHGVTLSQAQHDFTQAKITRLGLGGRVTVELKD